MIYLSKPNGTYGVFHSRYSQGAYDVHRLVPGRRYGGMDGGPGQDTYESTRDTAGAACAHADRLDSESAARPHLHDWM